MLQVPNYMTVHENRKSILTPTKHNKSMVRSM